ncbi:MAG: nucleotidyltransferase domain-containing protein [Phycisphaerae bacterium]|nr:nucleotidyltransferase domain-containing protein [Phycisphaerae bacterium]
MRTLDDLHIKENDRQAIREATAILRSRFPVRQVVLFGSKARGSDDAQSDIDLLVLTSRPVQQEEKDQMTDALFAVELQRAVVLNKLVVPLEQWEQGLYRVLPIHSEVARDGVLA